MTELKEEQFEKKEVKEELIRIIGQADEKVKVELYQSMNATRYGFTQLQNTYLNNSLRFADTKAGAVVAVNGLIMKLVIDYLVNVSGVIFYAAVGAIGLLVLSVFISILVVLPKKANSKGKGFIYWGYIANQPLEQYMDQIKNRPTEELLDESIRNNYYQSIILTKKFKYLTYAFNLSVAAYGLLILCGIMFLV